MKGKYSFFLCIFLILLSLSSAAAEEEDIGVKVFDQVSKSVAQLCTEDACGTGFFISKNHIVTNHHVVAGTTFQDKSWTQKVTGTKIYVIYSWAKEDYVSGTVAEDWPEVDLAVVRINTSDSKRNPINLAHESEIKPGMTVFVVGFPSVFDTDTENSDVPSITEGRLAKTSMTYIQNKSETYKQQSYSALINPGNSGGPVADRNGNVIGIANSSLRTDTETGYFGIDLTELTSRLEKAGISFSRAEATPTPKPTSTSNPTATSTPMPTATQKPSFTPTPTTIPTPTETSTPTGIFDKITASPLYLVIIIILLVLAVGIVIFSNRPSGNSPKKADKHDNEHSSIRQGKPTSSLHLHGLAGQFRGIDEPLRKDRDCIIGRDPEQCTLVFDAAEKNVSRVHCRLHYSRTNRCFVIQDLHSANGTFVVRKSKSQRVPADYALGLKDKDVIYIASEKNSFLVNLNGETD